MKRLAMLLGMLSVVCFANATTVWNPAGNGIVPPATGDFGEAANWTNGVPGGSGDLKAVFNVPGAAECQVAGSFSGMQIVQGDGNEGGILRVLDGGSLTTQAGNWSAVGYNNTAQTIVESGGTYNFSQHAWIGLNDGAVGTLDIYGTVTVGSMLGLGWSGTTSQGFVNIYDGGLLALSNIHGDGSSSIKHGSLLSIYGTGQLTLPGNFIGVIETYAANGLMAGNGVIGAVEANLVDGNTVVTAVPEPATMLLLGMGALALIRKNK